MQEALKVVLEVEKIALKMHEWPWLGFFFWVWTPWRASPICWLPTRHGHGGKIHLLGTHDECHLWWLPTCRGAWTCTQSFGAMTSVSHADYPRGMVKGLQILPFACFSPIFNRSFAQRPLIDKYLEHNTNYHHKIYKINTKYVLIDLKSMTYFLVIKLSYTWTLVCPHAS